MKFYYLETFADDRGKYGNIVPGKRFFFTKKGCVEIANSWIGGDNLRHYEVGTISFFEAYKKYPHEFSCAMNDIIDIFRPSSWQDRIGNLLIKD